MLVKLFTASYVRQFQFYRLVFRKGHSKISKYIKIYSIGVLLHWIYSKILKNNLKDGIIQYVKFTRYTTFTYSVISIVIHVAYLKRFTSSYRPKRAMSKKIDKK